MWRKRHAGTQAFCLCAQRTCCPPGTNQPVSNPLAAQTTGLCSASFSSRSVKAFACAKIKEQTHKRGCESRQRSNGIRKHEISHHPKCDDGEDNRGQRVTPHTIGPGDVRTRFAQHDDSHHSEQRAEEKTERGVLHYAFKTAREQKQIDDEQL